MLQTDPELLAIMCQNMHHLAISCDARLRTTTLQRNYSEPQASTIRCICACGNWKPNISPRRPTIRSCIMYGSDRDTVLPAQKKISPVSNIYYTFSACGSIRGCTCARTNGPFDISYNTECVATTHYIRITRCAIATMSKLVRHS